MARNRMVSDGFWKDADLASLTTEQRTALLLFLTAEESNIIGIYRVIWRAVGAGMGWTHDQILNAARDLQAKDCIAIHEETGWVWVKEWWKHNSLRGAFTGNVAIKAAKELKQVPEFWQQAVITWLTENDQEGACKPLISPLQGSGGNPNPTTSSIPNSTTTPNGGEVDIDELVEAAVWAALQVGEIKNEAGFRVKVRARILAAPNPEDMKSLCAWREAQAAQQAAAVAENLPVGRWKSERGSLIVIPDAGPVSITTSAGDLRSIPRAVFAGDLVRGEVRLLEIAA